MRAHSRWCFGSFVSMTCGLEDAGRPNPAKRARNAVAAVRVLFMISSSNRVLFPPADYFGACGTELRNHGDGRIPADRMSLLIASGVSAGLATVRFSFVRLAVPSARL